MMYPNLNASFLDSVVLQGTWNHHTLGWYLFFSLFTDVADFQLFSQVSDLLFFSKQGGDIYFESVNCGPNIAIMTFHSAWYRETFGKLGMVCLAGPPNIAKTNSLKVALHMGSSLNYFFSTKVHNQVPYVY